MKYVVSINGIKCIICTLQQAQAIIKRLKQVNPDAIAQLSTI